MRDEREVVRVLGVFPELTADLDERTAAAIRRNVVAEVEAVPVGSWQPPPCTPGCAGLLVLDGLFTRSVVLGGRRGTELLGPGDLLRPWDAPGDAAALPCSVAWRVLAPARVAILDAHFVGSVARWPSVLSRVIGLALGRSRALTMHLAVAQVPRLEDRLLLLFWHLADRYGRVERGGVRLPLRLSHEVLSELACARRPSVTLALKTLRLRGLLARVGSGWMLSHESLGQANALLELRAQRLAAEPDTPVCVPGVRQVPDDGLALVSSPA